MTEKIQLNIPVNYGHKGTLNLDETSRAKLPWRMDWANEMGLRKRRF